MEVYLDNSATTACFEEVAQLMHRILCEDYGNPSSLHHKGVEAEAYLRYANETFAKILKVNEKEVFFTSGGTPIILLWSARRWPTTEWDVI